MSYFGSVKIINKTGWSKVFILENAITSIGNDIGNDIVLPVLDELVSVPMYLQLICIPGNPNKVQAINLRNAQLPRFNTHSLRSDPIPPSQSADLQEGDQLMLGGYTAIFTLVGRGFIYAARSEDLGVELSLPSLKLNSKTPTLGRLTLTNFNRQVHSQFEVSLEGLPRDCYALDPVPLLHAGGSENLSIHFIHQGDHPNAGANPVTIQIAAPQTFPAQTAAISFDLDVEGVFSYAVGFDTLPNPEPEVKVNAEPPQAYIPALMEARQPKGEFDLDIELLAPDVPDQEPVIDLTSSIITKTEDISEPAIRRQVEKAHPKRVSRRSLPNLTNVKILREEPTDGVEFVSENVREI